MSPDKWKQRERELWLMAIGAALIDQPFREELCEHFPIDGAADRDIREILTAIADKDGRRARKWLVDNYVGEKEFKFDKDIRDRVNKGKLIDEICTQLKRVVGSRVSKQTLEMAAARTSDPGRAAEILRAEADRLEALE